MSCVNGIGNLPWPAQSSDLNIIENVWKTIKIRVQRRISEIKNADKLQRVVQEIWTALPQHYIYIVCMLVFPKELEVSKAR